MYPFFSKIFIVIAIIVTAWIGYGTWKEVDRSRRIQQEVFALQMEADKIQKENSVLREKIKYFQTDEFQSQEARNKLNYQGENENVVVVVPGTQSEDAISKNNITASDKSDYLIPNYKKWWNIFFAV